MPSFYLFGLAINLFLTEYQALQLSSTVVLYVKSFFFFYYFLLVHIMLNSFVSQETDVNTHPVISFSAPWEGNEEREVYRI